MRLLFLTLLSACGLAPAGFAQQTVTYTNEVPLTAAPYSIPMPLPQFDSALVLGEVALTGFVGQNVEALVENVGDVGLRVEVVYGMTSGITGLPLPFQIGTNLNTTINLDSFDGMLDYAGRSGMNLGSGMSSSMNTWTYTDPGDLAAFMGAGMLQYTAEATGDCSIDVATALAEVPLDVVCQPRGTARVSVTYTFDEDCNENGVADYLDLCAFEELAEALCSLDCNENGVPDECEPDCDEDGIPDDCDPGSCELNCQEFDRYEDLTPNDTLTVFTDLHNPEQQQGYVYAYAVDAANAPVAADVLIGHLLVVDGLELFEYSVNPVDYRAAVEAGAATDVDADGVRDLDGNEYEMTAAEILVPRFIGTDDQRGTYGELVLIGLSGGSQFETTADFLAYNDNEEQFSASYTFYCWDKVALTDISQVFRSEWLDNFTGDNDDESLAGLEYGWFRVNGGAATSSAVSLLDPALYAVYVEHVGATAVADLPFESCLQPGHLLPRSVTGDNSEVAGEPSVEECGVTLPRRRPASLLLYPEFDNRSGSKTILTVTNTSASEDARVHFRYVGRYGS